MITYQQLCSYIVLNLVIVSTLFLIEALVAKSSNKKSEGVRTGILFLICVCWMVFSWYYELRLSKQISPHLSSGNALLDLFLSFFRTIVYGFGVYLSIIGVFTFAVIGIIAVLDQNNTSMRYTVNRRKCVGCGMCRATCPEVFSLNNKGIAAAIKGYVPAKIRDNAERARFFCPVDAITYLNKPLHSPWPLWIAGLLGGFVSVYILKESMIPQLNNLTNTVADFIYVKILHTDAAFPEAYYPAAGIAAGTIITACFTRVYCRSKIGFLCYPAMILVLPLTAVLVTLVDFAGSILVLILVFATIQMKDFNENSYRHPIPFILLALAVGGLSGYYFYMNGLILLEANKAFTIAGGFTSGITVACLAFKAYSCYKDGVFRAMCFLAFIPFCTPGFSYAIAFIVSLIAAFIFLCLGLSGTKIYPGNEEQSDMRDPDGNWVKGMGNGRYEFAEGGQTVSVEKSGSEMNTYITSDGRKYVRIGNELKRKG